MLSCFIYVLLPFTNAFFLLSLADHTPILGSRQSGRFRWHYKPNSNLEAVVCRESNTYLTIF